MAKDRISAKRQALIDHYFECGFNATEAARRAGYKHPNVQGPTLVNLSIVKEEIQRRLAERTLSADQVLSLLAEHATANIGDFVNDTGGINWDVIRSERGRLVKKVIHEKGRQSQIELHDSQSALALLAKQLDLTNKERHEHSGSGGGPIHVVILPDNGRS